MRFTASDASDIEPEEFRENEPRTLHCLVDLGTGVPVNSEPAESSASTSSSKAAVVEVATLFLICMVSMLLCGEIIVILMNFTWLQQFLKLVFKNV